MDPCVFHKTVPRFLHEKGIDIPKAPEIRHNRTRGGDKETVPTKCHPKTKPRYIGIVASKPHVDRRRLSEKFRDIEDKLNKVKLNEEVEEEESVDEMQECASIASSTSDSWEDWRPMSFRIDFRPNEQDKEAYEKCKEFWKMIQSNPSFQRLLVKPEPRESVVSKASSVTSLDTQTKQDLMFPALKQLRNLTEAYMKPAFETEKECQKCQPKQKRTVKCSNTYAQMVDFNRSHPRSFKPPGPVPIVHHDGDVPSKKAARRDGDQNADADDDGIKTATMCDFCHRN